MHFNCMKMIRLDKDAGNVIRSIFIVGVLFFKACLQCCHFFFSFNSFSAS